MQDSDEQLDYSSTAVGGVENHREKQGNRGLRKVDASNGENAPLEGNAEAAKLLVSSLKKEKFNEYFLWTISWLIF